MKKESNKIKINLIQFSKKSIKKIKKNIEKDKIATFEFFEEISTFIKEYPNNLNQIRRFTKYKDIELLDFLEHHKKLRIIGVIDIINNLIFIENILFDHLGKDKLEYEYYWEGKENLDLKEENKIQPEKILNIKNNKDIDLINKFFL
jgi:hypothetical protein